MNRNITKRIDSLERRAGLSKPDVVCIRYNPTRPDDLRNKIRHLNQKYPSIPFFAIPPQAPSVGAWIQEVEEYQRTQAANCKVIEQQIRDVIHNHEKPTNG